LLRVSALLTERGRGKVGRIVTSSVTQNTDWLFIADFKSNPRFTTHFMLRGSNGKSKKPPVFVVRHLI
jgi:hypothetical protein